MLNIRMEFLEFSLKFLPEWPKSAQLKAKEMGDIQLGICTPKGHSPPPFLSLSPSFGSLRSHTDRILSIFPCANTADLRCPEDMFFPGFVNLRFAIRIQKQYRSTILFYTFYCIPYTDFSHISVLKSVQYFFSVFSPEYCILVLLD